MMAEVNPRVLEINPVTIERLKAAQRILDEALAIHKTLPDLPRGVNVVDLDRLEDTRRLTQAREGVAQAQHLVDVARGMATDRYRLARQPERLVLLRALRETTLAALAAARALCTFDEETAAVLGGTVGAAPIPQLFGLELALARLDREITPPTPIPAPVRPGYVKVRALERFRDRDGRVHQPGDGAVDDLPAEDLRVVVENQWAVEV